MNTWLTILAGGLLTFAIRASFLVLFADRPLPPALTRWLRFVPAAALAALIAPELVASGSESPVMVAKIAAAVVAGVVAAWQRNVAWAVVAGMAVFASLHATID